MRMMMRHEQRRGIYEFASPAPPCNVSRCQKSRLPTLLSSPLTRSRRQAPLSVPLMTSWPNSEKPRSPTPSSWNTRQQLLAPSIYGTSWRITPSFSMPKTLASPQAFHACTSTRDTAEPPPPPPAPAADPDKRPSTTAKTVSSKDPVLCDDPQRNSTQGNEVIFGGHLEMDAAPSASLNPYSRKADACASSVAAPAAPPPPSKRPKKTHYCQICDKEMPQFLSLIHI